MVCKFRDKYIIKPTSYMHSEVLFEYTVAEEWQREASQKYEVFKTFLIPFYLQRKILYHEFLYAT
jgi:hypothetical protein